MSDIGESLIEMAYRKRVMCSAGTWLDGAVSVQERADETGLNAKGDPRADEVQRHKFRLAAPQELKAA